MASNRLPDPLDELITLGEDAADGAHQLETAIGLQQNKEVGIRTDLADLVAKKNAYDSAVSARVPLASALTVARSNARAYLTLARDIFKTFLGSKPSSAWEAAGWPNDSIAVPATSERILPLLKSVELYLTANPARENATLNLTKTRASDLHAVLSDGRSAVNNQDNLIAAGKTARDASEDELRKRLRGLIDELSQLLDEMDPRWLSFGLKRPGAPDSPDAVENTRATALGGGKVRVQCDPAPRAEYYQVWIQVVGVDADFRLADSPAEPDKILEGFTAGVTVKTEMRAVNETGPSPFGEPVQVAVT